MRRNRNTLRLPCYFFILLWLCLCIMWILMSQMLTLYSFLCSNSIIDYIISMNPHTNNSATLLWALSLRDGGRSLISETWPIVLYNSALGKLCGPHSLSMKCDLLCDGTMAMQILFWPVGLALTGDPLGCLCLIWGQTIGVGSVHATLHWIQGRRKTTTKRWWKMSAQRGIYCQH